MTALVRAYGVSDGRLHRWILQNVPLVRRRLHPPIGRKPLQVVISSMRGPQADAAGGPRNIETGRSHECIDVPNLVGRPSLLVENTLAPPMNALPGPNPERVSGQI